MKVAFAVVIPVPQTRLPSVEGFASLHKLKPNNVALRRLRNAHTRFFGQSPAGVRFETSSTRFTPRHFEVVAAEAKTDDAFDLSYSFGQVPLGNVGVVIGSVFIIYGFSSYISSGEALSALSLTYGLPIFIIGWALKYGELQPVSYEKNLPSNLVALRKAQATPTQLQVFKDVTRYRYGDEQHLDEALKRTGLHPRGKEAPKLVALREEEIDGHYALVLMFASSEVGKAVFEQNIPRIEKFFGPNITATVSDWQKEIDLPSDKQEEDTEYMYDYEIARRQKPLKKIEVALISKLGSVKRIAEPAVEAPVAE
eukprot:CAMPEP_0196655998 /NCGR_PEP_ID=MMETSP1086-20130531/11836_1 /TAXON_ID=77921 /ORGANISM="Cyanoptyche  gloeocystis , Strain SAG4.97" /LENGTH=310 /DNA_ID=CAMNT_0041988567 /DNA_START=44 /DNA_END=976 /DNA_ORIENTATION=-